MMVSEQATRTICRPLDREALCSAYMNASPFPFVKIDDFPDTEFARQVASSYPSFDQASMTGKASAVSFHGITPVADQAPFPRPSFATYYYTRQAPPNWTGTIHDTVFKARPEERLRRYILMPMETLRRRLRNVRAISNK